jgi:NADPH:quinone reductase-like Zn-dependent oxidoreductase
VAGHDREDPVLKAAVVHGFGDSPRFEDFAEPVAGANDLTVRVQAVALENFDRMTVSGEHYASKHLFPQFPAVVGHSGVGFLEDGTLVNFGGVKPPFGAMAEIAVVPNEYRMFVTPVPQGIDAAVAAALPASALTSLLPLKYGVKLRPGVTVLVNGATGVSGKLAVQIARLLGAGRIVGTGRNADHLASLVALGAGATIDLKAPDDELTRAFEAEAGEGYDVVLDYLWGRPTELLLDTLVPKEAGFARRRVRFVQIGQAAGATISLAADTLRTSGLELTGAGNIYPEFVPDAMKQTWEWIATGALHMDVHKVPLKDVAQAWEGSAEGTRIVIVP